jgi:hypothetical protein
MPFGGALSVGAAGLGILKGGIDAIGAGGQLKKDKAELAGLTPSFYKIQDEYFGNRNDAATLAGGGFTQDSKDFFSDQSSRGLGTGISGTLQAGGSPNDIARIFDSYNNNVKNFAAADSEKHLENIKYFHQVNKDLAGQKNIQWSLNEDRPYQNKLKELTERINADKQNKNNAINSVIGGISSAGTALTNANLTSKLFPDQGGDIAEIATLPNTPGAEGNWTLPGKFNTEKKDFVLPDNLNLTEEQQQGLYKFLHRGV